MLIFVMNVNVDWCPSPRNNWFRLKRYIVIDFTKQLNERRGDDDPLNVEVSFDKMRGTSPTGARKILLPSEPTPSAYAGLSSRIYDTRNFFLSPKRLRLFRDIDKRCEVFCQALNILTHFQSL